jgi:hypothetical protein
VLAAVALSTLTMGCGEDRSDAPGGSAPPITSAGTETPTGTGPANSGALSPEARDEAHPTTPAAPVATDSD